MNTSAADTASGVARLAGAATPAGTAAAAARFSTASFYRPAWDGLSAASIGLGTYLGEPDAATDAAYAAAVRRYLQLGGNLIDCAINYRFQRSERAVGAALAAAIAAGEASREAVIVCTKGGYLSFEGGWPADPEGWVRQTFLDTGLVEPGDIVDGHCMAPAYLRHQIAQSRANLQVECLDLYYLHNPEGQLAALGEEVFRERLREAFATLEVAVSQGHLRAYGAATWGGLRARPGAPDYLPLQTLLAAARDVSGDQHHFRAVQLPFNFQMLEAAGLANQPGAAGPEPLLQAAAEHGVAVMASAPLLQSRLVGRLPARLRSRFEPNLTDAQRALQFVRSAPGLTAALAGMSRVAHVDENLGLREIAPMTPTAWRAVFEP
jgi:aryl-alcohol dehydrogenase-like predicted oxidoreductase